jgi:hypothetical protein
MNALMETSSIAIWNRNKVVTALVTGAWATNVAFLIQGKSVHSCQWTGILYTIPAWY